MGTLNRSNLKIKLKDFTRLQAPASNKPKRFYNSFFAREIASRLYVSANNKPKASNTKRVYYNRGDYNVVKLNGSDIWLIREPNNWRTIEEPKLPKPKEVEAFKPITRQEKTFSEAFKYHSIANTISKALKF